MKNKQKILLKAHKEFCRRYPKDTLSVDIRYAKILVEEATASFRKMLDEARMKFMGSISKEMWDKIFGFLESKLEEK